MGDLSEYRSPREILDVYLCMIVVSLFYFLIPLHPFNIIYHNDTGGHDITTYSSITSTRYAVPVAVVAETGMKMTVVVLLVCLSTIIVLVFRAFYQSEVVCFI